MSVSSQYPTLDPKATAVAVRKVLKAAFPACKFSVVTERGSMMSSVRVSWTDGPTVNAVEALVEPFEAGKFNGMTDSFDYDNSRALNVEGVLYRPGTRYVTTSRRKSAAFANRCIAQVAAFYGVTNPPRAVEWHGGFTIADGRGNETPAGADYEWYSLIHQAAGDATRFAATPTEV